MKRENGFTLIELLAIIVILAIIAVITVPIILNIIDSSKKGAKTDSFYGYKDAIQKYYVTKLYEDPNYTLNGTYTVDELETLGVQLNGEKPEDGWVKIEKGNAIDYSLKFDDYTINLDSTTNKPVTTKNGEITTSPSEWFTYSEADANGHVSITGFDTEEYDGSVTDIIFPMKDTNGNLVTEIGERAFLNNHIITSVVILSNITKINNMAFIGASSIENAKLQGSVENIGNSAFQNTGLTSITIPNGVNTIGSLSFANTNITEANIPDSVTVIGQTAFYGNVKKATIGSGVQTMGSDIFGGPGATKALEELTISMSNIPDSAFQDCVNLKKVVLKNGVTTIGTIAFVNSAIEQIEIPESVETINPAAFQNNTVTKIINKTGRAFDWNIILKGQTDTAFETGTVTIGDRTVEITNN